MPDQTIAFFLGPVKTAYCKSTLNHIGPLPMVSLLEFEITLFCQCSWHPRPKLIDSVYALLNTNDRIISCTAGKYFEYSEISALYIKK